MKNNIIKALAVFALGGGLVSCSKQLDKSPYDAINLGQAFQTIKDAQTWDNGLYAKLRGSVYGLFTYTTDVQADQLNAGLDYGNRNGSPHRWDDFISSDYSISGIWSGYYNTITNANIAIAGYPSITGLTGADADRMKAYEGDAYLIRAYCYHQLVIRWAKAYEPGTAANDEGVPLVLTYNPNATPARATVQQVYDQVLSDIAQAKTLLAGVSGTQGATNFTIDAVLALEARVRLFMQDWAGAKAAADAVINKGTYPLISNKADFISMWTNDLGNEVIFQSEVSAPDELANANSIYLGLIPSSGKYDPDFIPSKWVVDMYDNADIRKAAYFDQKTLTVSGNDYAGIYLVNKYPGNPKFFTGATTNYQQKPKVFRVAELYLISAEAGARSNNAAGALTALNALRTKRGLPALSGLTGDALMQAVKDERFRELAFEGFRLDDLKRWHEGFTRKDPQNLNIIVVGPQYQALSEPADAPKFTWGIPLNDMTANPSLKGHQNPGW